MYTLCVVVPKANLSRIFYIILIEKKNDEAGLHPFHFQELVKLLMVLALANTS